MKKIQMLDVTLRDGAYINHSHFGVPALRGIIQKMQDANIEIIECGWLKNAPYEEGSSYYHVPADLIPYLPAQKKQNETYVVMIDWDRYDLNNLPENNGKSIDAIRVVFPHGKAKGGAAVAKEIKAKGYQVYFQIANTLAGPGCQNQVAVGVVLLMTILHEVGFADIPPSQAVLLCQLRTLPVVALGAVLAGRKDCMP